MLSPVVLINTFEIHTGMENEFVEWWERSSEALKKEPGFIDARLHKSLKSGSRFQFINVAHWETEESLNLARTRNKEILQSLTVGKGIPALYEVTSQYVPTSGTGQGIAYGQQQYPVIVCPDCQRECQVIGRMENSIYSWCQCNRYIQIYDQVVEN